LGYLDRVAELKPKKVDVRCPYPGHRWRRGDPGPCGLKLGELRFAADGSVRLFSLSFLVDQGDGLFEVLGKPTKGPAAALRATNAVDSKPVPAGGDMRLRCPQCGVETHLSKLTTSVRPI
jgi:DNA-directed RNA polymerase subunit RPC12/RpoP